MDIQSGYIFIVTEGKVGIALVLVLVLVWEGRERWRLRDVEEKANVAYSAYTTQSGKHVKLSALSDGSWNNFVC